MYIKLTKDHLSGTKKGNVLNILDSRGREMIKNKEAEEVTEEEFKENTPVDSRDSKKPEDNDTIDLSGLETPEQIKKFIKDNELTVELTEDISIEDAKVLIELELEKKKED